MQKLENYQNLLKFIQPQSNEGYPDGIVLGLLDLIRVRVEFTQKDTVRYRCCPNVVAVL